MNQPPSTTSKTAIGAAGVDRLSNRVIWAYAAPRIGTGILGILFSTYLMKFSTDVLLIAPAVMGGLIAGSRLWDAFSDPLVGYLSDNTHSRFGRRRVWLLGSAIPMGIGMVMIWSPPMALDGFTMVIWMAVALLVYETASTAFYVPHGAIGVELTPNYHERTRLFGNVHMLTAIGLLLGLGALQIMNTVEDKRSFAVILSISCGATVAILILWSAWVMPERNDFQGRGGGSVVKSFIDVVRNPHARLLLIMYGIETFGGSSIALLVPFLLEYVLPMKVYMVPLLITYVIPQFAFTPLFIWLSRRIGKKTLWGASMWVAAAMFILTFFVVIPGEFSYLIWPGTFIFGLCGGCAAVTAPSIKADIIDYDEYLTGERKEGAYLAVWNLVRKAAGSLTALATGLVLQFTGFEPNIVQNEQVQYWILGLFSLLPGICYLIGAIIFMRFSFNEKEHAEVREVLEARMSQ
jgi:GPH family glycoside/pentoside/hexuronide:cation symporter